MASTVAERESLDEPVESLAGVKQGDFAMDDFWGKTAAYIGAMSHNES